MIHRKLLACSFSFVATLVIVWFGIATPVLANNPPIPSNPNLQSKDFIIAAKPTKKRAGGNRGSNSHRGACSALPQTNLLALIPPDNEGFTIEPFPSFWFYMPYTRESGLSGARFMLLNEDLRPVMTEPIAVALPDTPGVMRFQLPNQVASLEVGQRYNWYFWVVCDPEKPSRNPVVSGWIERIAPPVELINQLKTTPADREYLIFDENGIWFDALTRLAQQRCRIPQNSTVQEDWHTLLREIEMETLTSQPIVCKPSEKV
jgi:hypothetical protein